MPVLRSSHPKGFTVLELIVAVTVTAMLSGMLLLISNQVLETQSRASAELEHNQIAHFVLDQIQEDLQCALFRNDGNVWMAIRLLEDKSNSGSWINASKSEFSKPPLDSLRIISSDWPTDSLADSQIDVLGQGPWKNPVLESQVLGCGFLLNPPNLTQVKKIMVRHEPYHTKL